MLFSNVRNARGREEDIKLKPHSTTLDATPTSTITDCVCGSTLIAGINFAVSGTATTSYCATGTAPPTGYTQVPYGPGAPAWATDLDPAAPCGDPTIPDASCWQALDVSVDRRNILKTFALI